MQAIHVAKCSFLLAVSIRANGVKVRPCDLPWDEFYIMVLCTALAHNRSASPWTITYRPFENNVHKICYAVLPLLALLRLVNPGPAGVAFGVTFLFGSLMSQVGVVG